MSEQIEFDGNYGRTGKIEVKVERCCACKVHGPCLVADQSNGEYSPAIICSNCIAKMFGATQPQAPQGAVTGWQLIETAPEDSVVLLMEGMRVFIGGKVNGVWLTYHTDSAIHPTHWMPFPAAPETPEGAKP